MYYFPYQGAATCSSILGRNFCTYEDPSSNWVHKLIPPWRDAARAAPAAGDEVAVMGPLVWDCGHQDQRGYLTEIHPPIAMAWMHKFGSHFGDIVVKATSNTHSPMVGPHDCLTVNGGCTDTYLYSDPGAGLFDAPFEADFEPPDGYLPNVPIYLSGPSVNYNSVLSGTTRLQGCHLSSVGVLYSVLTNNPFPQSEVDQPFAQTTIAPNRPLSNDWNISLTPVNLGSTTRLHLSLSWRGIVPAPMAVSDWSDHGSVQVQPYTSWQSGPIRNPVVMGLHYFVCQPVYDASGKLLNGCCPQGYTACNGQCVADSTFSSDVWNCGYCGNMCTRAIPNSYPVCAISVCSFACNSGYTFCAGPGCVSLTNDVNNCGACGKVCSPGVACQGGVCQCIPSCGGANCGGPDGCGGVCPACCSGCLPP
jgi:hypothetical protein